MLKVKRMLIDDEILCQFSRNFPLPSPVPVLLRQESWKGATVGIEGKLRGSPVLRACTNQ